MTAYFLDGAPDGVRVARVGRKELHRSIVEGISAGIRTGIPARMLDGYTSHRAAREVVMVDGRHVRLKDLGAKAAAAHKRADKAMAVMEGADTPEEEQLVRDRVRRHLEEERRYRADIARLEAEAEAVDLEDSFDGEVGYLMTALEGLLAGDGLVTTDQASALATVLDDLRLEARGTKIHWQARILLPADGHVVSLGPFAGHLDMVGRPATPASLEHVRSGLSSITHRRNALDDLVAAGYDRGMAIAATLAPGPWLVEALLGEPTEWPEVPTGFDHEGFSQYVRTCWRGLDAWSGSSYAIVNPNRQKAVDFIAERGGSVSLDKVVQALPDLGFSRSLLNGLMAGRKTSSGNVMPPVLRKGGEWLSHKKHWDKALVENAMCPKCGRPATAVVMVPEVPDGLLCKTCRVMPSQPGRVYPGLYGRLALELN